MADEHQRASAARELGLQPFDGRQVEMVGRLVEQQDVGRGRQHAGQRGAARFAAGEFAGVLLAGEAELLQQVARADADRRRAQARLDIGERGRRSPTGPAPAAGSGSVAPGCTKRVPPSGSIRPAAIFSSVDLPEPLRPTRHDPLARRDRQLGAAPAAACRRR